MCLVLTLSAWDIPRIQIQLPLRVRTIIDVAFSHLSPQPSQSLDVDLADRAPLLDDLRAVARPLIDTCDADTRRHIDAAVRQAETAWSETRDNLQELCTKYQRAADVWRRYRDASEAVKQWADTQMSTLGALQPLDAAKQVEVCVTFCAAVCMFVCQTERCMGSFFGLRLACDEMRDVVIPSDFFVSHPTAFWVCVIN